MFGGFIFHCEECCSLFISKRNITLKGTVRDRERKSCCPGRTKGVSRVEMPYKTIPGQFIICFLAAANTFKFAKYATFA